DGGTSGGRQGRGQGRRPGQSGEGATGQFHRRFSSVTAMSVVPERMPNPDCVRCPGRSWLFVISNVVQDVAMPPEH
ncbi:hypothetical protein ABT314_35965, partial [Streptomyces spiralis]